MLLPLLLLLLFLSRTLWVSCWVFLHLLFFFHFILTPNLEALAQSSGHNEWRSLEDLRFPVSQRSLFRTIDDACSDHLLHSAPDSRSKALALSSSIPHSVNWLNEDAEYKKAAPGRKRARSHAQA